MQKKIGIVLFIIMLLGIVAIPYYIKNNETNNEINKEEVKEEVVEDSQIPIFNLDESTLSRLEIKDERALIFEKRDGQWIEPEESTLAYNKEAIQKIITSISSLESIQIIRNVSGQSKYGIDETARIITLYDEANNHYTLRIGSATADEKGLYIATDADETIYIINSKLAEPLFGEKEDLVEKQMLIPEIATIESFDINIKNEPALHIRKNDKEGYKDYQTWILEDFFKSTHEIHTETIDAMLNQIIAFQKDKFVGSKTTLEQYGLDKPSMVITLNNKWTIKFGKKEDEFIYFMYSKEPYVYKMLEENIKDLMDIKPIALIRKQVYIPDAAKLSQIKLTNPVQTLVFDLSPGKNSFDPAQTEQILQLIEDSVCIEAKLQNPEIEQKQERKAEASILYTYKDNSTKMIELIPYDSSFYILRFENTIEFAVGKEKIMSMFNNVDEMVKANKK